MVFDANSAYLDDFKSRVPNLGYILPNWSSTFKVSTIIVFWAQDKTEVNLSLFSRYLLEVYTFPHEANTPLDYFTFSRTQLMQYWI